MEKSNNLEFVDRKTLVMLRSMWLNGINEIDNILKNKGTTTEEKGTTFIKKWFPFQVEELKRNLKKLNEQKKITNQEYKILKYLSENYDKQEQQFTNIDSHLNKPVSLNIITQQASVKKTDMTGEDGLLAQLESRGMIISEEKSRIGDKVWKTYKLNPKHFT